ncbi:MAG: O-methyltransferase [Alphaproteobacteria bacterium]
MSLENLFSNPLLDDYIKKVGYRESANLVKLRTHMMNFPGGPMQTAPEVTQLLAFLIQTSKAKYVLELGTLGGYSATAMAEALLEKGKIITCDHDSHITKIAKEFWEEFGHKDQIELRLGPALETLSELLDENQVFDFMYIDADKKAYDQYYEYGLKLLKPNGLMVLDNTLQKGKISPEMDILNQKIHQDNRVISLLLPFSDGVTLVHKR